MKTLLLLSIVLFCLASCQLEEAVSPKTTTPAPNPEAIVIHDTIPDKAGFKIKLLQDSTDGDETMLTFDHRATRKYSSGNDAPYFPGFGQVSLASISSDGVDLAIAAIPYTPNMSIGLDVRVKTDGIYMLKISYANNIPANIRIWLKDAHLKDSINVCSGNYSFSVTKADTSTFGKNRFKLVLKDTNN